MIAGVAGADPRIEDYAAIGNCRTVALVSRWGSVDWLCVPHYSGPSFFGALLDQERGGAWAVEAVGATQVHQHYLERTNVVVTTFAGPDGVLELTDLIAIHEDDEAGQPGAMNDLTAPHALVRIARCTAGRVVVNLRCRPRPGYALSPALPREVQGSEGRQWRWAWPEGAARLHTSCPLQPQDDGLCGLVALSAGQQLDAVLIVGQQDGISDSAPCPAGPLLEATIRYWRRWAERCRYEGPYREEVIRSALALKLLAYRPSGAVVAAGTTSIPEGPNGSRNWDYRYCWLRDTSLVLRAFMDLGYLAESEAFLRWLLHATRETRPRLQVLYDVLGRSQVPERVLDHLRGYHGVGPVRIGNDAARQRQMDIYGQVILTAHEFVREGGRLSDDERSFLSDLVEMICLGWHEPDEGLWEIRLPRRHNTHSRIMCWVGLDCALQLNRHIGLDLDVDRVTAILQDIRADVETHGFDPQLASYVGYYGGQSADASLLLIPRLGYLAADDPRMQATLRCIVDQLGQDGLLFRYPPGPGYDGVAGPENLFVICGFWLVDCLARMDRRQEAQALFERLLALRNHVGLLAEELEVGSLRPIGNFPQAFSHVGLINAALSLWPTR